jgi:hypothetical protein
MVARDKKPESEARDGTPLAGLCGDCEKRIDVSRSSSTSAAASAAAEAA